MPVNQASVDRLIVRLLEMKNHPEIKVAREMEDSPVIYNAKASNPIFWSRLSATGMAEFRQLHSELDAAVANCLLTRHGQDVWRVDLEVLEQLRLVDFDVISDVDYEREHLHFVGSDSHEFCIVDKKA